MKPNCIIGQKATVALIASALTALLNLASVQTGRGQSAPALVWQAVAASADGNLLLAAANTASAGSSSSSPPASIYLSTNGGATWNPTSAPADLWQSVAVSADGTLLIAAAAISFQAGDPPSISGDGLIYTSTNFGVTWVAANVPNNAWTCVAASADGSSLVAAASLLRPGADGAVLSGDGLIYMSTNSGASWYLANAPSGNWKSIACSSDATRLVAAVEKSGYANPGGVYVSTNAGSTWVQPLTAGICKGFSSVASSADGMRLVAVDPPGCGSPPYDGVICVSTNAGQSWAIPNLFREWRSVACSADGMTLAAVSDDLDWPDADVWLSLDGGASWAQTGLQDGSWTAVACSADGRKLVAAGEDGRLVTLPYTGPWRTVEVPPTSWYALTSSQDGSKLVATDGSQIYRSTDSGTSWSTTSAPSNNWEAVASSADGGRLVAAAQTFAGGYIYLSTNAAAAWSQAIAPDLQWAAVASSADGATLVAAPRFGSLYVSTNSGATFTSSGPMNDWASVASSADGIRLVAVGGLIYVSTNSGASWTSTSAPATNWTLVASSADGTQLVAAGGFLVGGWDCGCFSFYGLIYISRDSGASWSTTTAPLKGWQSLASSADGAKLVAVAPGFVCISTDSGVSWEVNAPGNNWTVATVPGDGSNIVALSDDGLAGVLHWPLPPPAPRASPVLSMTRSGANPLLSWLVPSTRFTLQQTADLSSPNWIDVTNQPTFNLTNLHNELTLAPPGRSAFYRLKRP